MTCELCHQHEATVHIQEISGGKKVSHHLCAGCAQAKGLVPTGENTLSLASALLKMVKADLAEAGGDTDTSSGITDLDALVCPGCGLSGADFRQHGRLGCARCYDTFKPVLDPLLPTLHRGLTHVGKAGSGTAQPSLPLMPPPVAADTPPAAPVVAPPAAPPTPPAPPSPAEVMAGLEEELRCAVVVENYERAAQIRDQIRALRAPPDVPATPAT